MGKELGLVDRLLDYAVRFRAANGEHTSGTLLAVEAAAQIGRLGAHVTTLLRTAQEDLVLMQETAATVTSLRERAEAAEARLVAKDAAIERLLAERDEARKALKRADTVIDLGLDLISDRKGWGTYQRMEGVELYEDADNFEKAAEAYRARQALEATP